MVMNRQKTFRKLILFCVFAKSTSFVRAVEESAESETRGAGEFS
jgi:hypothetical protein